MIYVQAFGVGAFEEEDEDIYAKDDMSQYDFALDTPSMLAEKRKKEKHSKQLLALPPSGTQILEGKHMIWYHVVCANYPY